jgi:DNA polymerase-3 subunit delta'
VNPALEALLRKPPHGLLITGAESAAAGESFAARLLGDDRTYLRSLAPADGSISIEQIRELLAFFQLKVPGSAPVKRAAVIARAETMTHEAQNALLKLLEEPPADSVLVLATDRPQELLATVRSRLQTVHVSDEPSAPDSEAVQLVKQALAGTAYDRLLLIDGPLKSKEMAKTFVTTLETVATASLSSVASKGQGIERWQRVLQAAYTAREAFELKGNTKLVLTDLMLSI